jgi:hypothetical protein
LEQNLLNGRTFSSLRHLNETTSWWLAHVADVRVHKTTQRTPLDLYQEELPHLLPLPEKPYDTAEVVYRTVNPEGFITYLQNFYSVPWQRIGQLLPVRVTETELIRTRRFGKDEAVRILGLLSTYHQQDLVAALQRAHRYRAFCFAAVERILGAFAEPRSALESIGNQAREHLDELLRENPVPPRPTGDYQQLLDDSADRPSTEENPR